jgi:hypothetical protein
MWGWYGDKNHVQLLRKSARKVVYAKKRYLHKKKREWLPEKIDEGNKQWKRVEKPRMLLQRVFINLSF